MSTIQVNLDDLSTIDVQLEHAFLRQGTIDPANWIGDDTVTTVNDVFTSLSDTSKEMSLTVDSLVKYLHDVAKAFKEKESELSNLFTSFDVQGASKTAQRARQFEASRQSKYYTQLM